MPQKMEVPAEPSCFGKNFFYVACHLEFIFFVICFLLTLWHFDVSPTCALGPERPWGNRAFWSVKATFKHWGAIPFPESRKTTFEEAWWDWVLSFPPLT